MTDRKSSPPISRRAFGAGLAALAATPVLAATAHVPGWPPRETYPLWPAMPPGGKGYAPQSPPPGWNPAHLRSTAMPTLNVFRPDRPDGRALLVCPGGAYLFVSIDNEGVDVARRFNPFGITVFVLSYRLPNEGWAHRADVPLQDAQRAMRWIRANAARFAIDPARLGVLGFSAGGHLAGTLATDHGQPVYAPVDAADRQSARPAFAGLIYPVIAMDGPFAHAQSSRMLLGDGADAAAVAARSPARRVTAATPPCFLAHALDDDAVPADNSIAMTQALRAANILVETHLFAKGRHAFGVGRPDTPSRFWPDLFEAWTAEALG